MRVNSSVYIERPVAEVFTFIADPANDRHWRAELTSSEAEGEVRHGLGAHIRQTVAYQGRTAGVSLEVTEFEPGRRICFRARGGLRAHGCYDLRPDGPGTLLTVSVTLELKGDEAMLERYVRQAVGQVADVDLVRLREELETTAEHS